MSNIIIVAGGLHEQLGNFFSDRGTLDSIATYSNVVKNEKVLEMGTYETDKFIYVNFQDDMDIQSDMVALSRILKSNNSFFTINELIIFTLEKEEDLKIFDTVKGILQDEAVKNDRFLLPKIEINVFDKPVPYETIYSKVLGIVRFAPKKTRYRNLYKVERNGKKGDVYDKGDYSSEVITPFNFKQTMNYEKLKDNIVKTSIGEILFDEDRTSESMLISDVSLQRFTYRDSRKSKYIYFTGERRTGVTTHLLSFATAIIASKKSVTILDFSEKSDILDRIDENGIPYNSISMKELVNGSVKPADSGLNILADYPVDKVSFLKWFASNQVELKTDFVLFDFPIELKDWINKHDSIVVRIQEMEEKGLANFELVTPNDVVILTDIFYKSRSCSDDIAKEYLEKANVHDAIAPFDIDLSTINIRLMEEILGGGN